MDRLNKNQSLVDKVNVMAGLMNQIPDKTPERKRIPQKKLNLIAFQRFLVVFLVITLIYSVLP